MEATHGRFTFFGLFNVAGSFGRWDVVVAAPWLSRNSTEYEDLDNQLKKTLGRKRLDWMQWVEILDVSSPEYHVIMLELGEVDGLVEKWRQDLFGFEYFFDRRRVDKAIVFRAERPAPTRQTKSVTAGRGQAKTRGKTKPARRKHRHTTA